MARLTKLTPETQRAFLAAIEKGASYELAAKAAGISERTVYNWLNKAETDIQKGNLTEYVQFLQAIKKAEGQAALRWLEVIDKAAANGNWQAAAWKLERKYPHEWGKLEKRQLSMATLMLEPDYAKMSTEELKERLLQLQAIK